MIGLKKGTPLTNPGGNSYDTITYGVACRGDGSTATAHYGGNYANNGVDLGTYTVDNLFEIKIVGSTITWHKDGVLKMTKTETISWPLHV